MKMIFGLGNFGNEFNETVHNCGFMVVDKLCENFGGKFGKTKQRGIAAEIFINNEKVLLIKPQTYMNDSGECVLKYVKKFKVPLKDILVISDDIDLPAGDIRYREKGSAGTHNGLRNIVALLGTCEFKRIRIGVGKPPENMELFDFVLSKLSGERKTLVMSGIEKACEKIVELIKN